MSQIISKFPAMMLGFIGENDLKILEYDEDIVVFESANDIEQPFDLTLCIFDLPSYDYKEYCFRNCILQKKYQSTYSYIFHVQLPDKTTPRLIQFHTFKNAANPPFLGGFSIFSIVAA